MKQRHLAVAGALALLIAASCEPELTLSDALKGKPCRPLSAGRQCVEGYECVGEVCVLQGSMGGRGGSSSLPGGNGGAPPVGSSGSGSGGASSGGAATGGSAGDTSIGGTSSAGGTTTVNLPDAAAPADAATDGCVPGQLYQDLDGDQYGGLAVAEVGCPHDGLVTTPGDCFDAVPTLTNHASDVYPGQTEYFGTSYPDSNTPGGFSFDFNCSGEEEADDRNFPSGEARNCGLLGTAIGACSGSGYEPDDRRPNGGGVISICGSEIVITCFANGLVCAADRQPTIQLYLCR